MPNGVFQDGETALMIAAETLRSDAIVLLEKAQEDKWIKLALNGAFQDGEKPAASSVNSRVIAD